MAISPSEISPEIPLQSNTRILSGIASEIHTEIPSEVPPGIPQCILTDFFPAFLPMEGNFYRNFP